MQITREKILKTIRTNLSYSTGSSLDIINEETVFTNINLFGDDIIEFALDIGFIFDVKLFDSDLKYLSTVCDLTDIIYAKIK